MMLRATAPNRSEIAELAKDLGIGLSEEELTSYEAMFSGSYRIFRWMDVQEEAVPPVKYPRAKGYRPSREENPYNAWFWRTEIRGDPDGPLAGKRAGIKDTVCVAGIPMINGGRLLEGFIPETDATVVTRLLDAGATILGKTTVNDGAGDSIETNSPLATVRNPRRPTHAPGGSSNGSAAALAAGDIDLAIGGDQGGSIRIPASWSGVVGLKPTHGLVPYTGVVTIDMTIDHIGPMANSVDDVASMLSVIAGPDPFDPRTRGVDPPDTEYGSAVDRGVGGLRIGLLKEGFGQAPWEDIGLPGSEAVVDAKVRAAARELAAAGAIVSEVSVPMHFDGLRIFYGFYAEGAAQFMINGNFMGTNWLGYYNRPLAEFHGAALRDRPTDLSPAFKGVLLLGEHLRRTTFGRYYAIGQNLRPRLREAYDRALSECDVFILPTTPFRATPIPPDDCGTADRIAFAMQMIGNTCQFGATGHPAISVPCGMEDGLPIGLQVVGRHLDEHTVLRVAGAVEQIGDWRDR